MPDFPAAIPDIPDSSPSETLSTMHGGMSHVTGTNRILANLRSLSQKLGLGNAAGPGSSPGGVLRRTATNESAWGLVQTVDFAPGAIDGGSLNDGSITSAKLLDGTIMNIDVNAAAAILITKLANLPANTVLRGNLGNGNVAGQVQHADVLAGSLGADRLQNYTLTALQLADSCINRAAQVANGVINYLHIANGQVLAQHIGANQVQSNHIYPGHVQSQHVLAGALNYSHLGTGGNGIHQWGFANATGGSQITAGGMVPITGTYCPLNTVAGQAGVMVIITVTISQSTPGAYVWVGTAMDGGAATTQAFLPAAAGEQLIVTMFNVYTPGAGTHYWTGMWQTNGGTATVGSGTIFAIEMRR